MAQICNALLMADFRILVTALTNRALIELAEKDHLKNALKDAPFLRSKKNNAESKTKTAPNTLSKKEKEEKEKSVKEEKEPKEKKETMSKDISFVSNVKFDQNNRFLVGYGLRQIIILNIE